MLCHVRALGLLCAAHYGHCPTSLNITELRTEVTSPPLNTPPKPPHPPPPPLTTPQHPPPPPTPPPPSTPQEVPMLTSQGAYPRNPVALERQDLPCMYLALHNLESEKAFSEHKLFSMRHKLTTHNEQHHARQAVDDTCLPSQFSAAVAASVCGHEPHHC